ncbi:ABC transporter permease [Streptomyces tsukubensis]|uniref:Transport permease protein n=1 Tax=Streptomyces tsukubensis TaxID=83656 RepID=A0A1V4A0M7_9ACTN|nr:ABC transporter permease [Streptomyces tsukubensis]OON72049.1 ABC transporter [Streptomyces tsukubensis]QFR93266.1 ABC transporter permease [Streptomyces tsukubensis]
MSAATVTAPPRRPAPTPAPVEARIGPRAHLRHIGALVRRNLLAIKQDPESMFDAVFMPIVLTLLFVYVFGGAIAGKGNQHDYVNYLVPGLMAMMGMNIAMGVGTGFNQDFQTGIMDRFRALPIARSAVLMAKLVVEVARMLVATAILLGIGFALGLSVATSVWGLLAAVGLALLFGSAIMWIFLTLGVTMKNAQAIQGVGMMVMMPLQFGSSIFAPTTSMPGWLQGFTDYNPLSALADASRGLINGGPLAHGVTVTLIWSVVLTAVMAPIAIHKFRTKS